MEDLRKSDIQVVDATFEDDWGIRTVRHKTWLATYPNVEHGITVQDVESEFIADDTQEGKAAALEKHRPAYWDPTFKFVVAKDGDEVVGFLIGRRLEDVNRLLAIYVLPQYQGQGIGARLFEKGLGWFDPKKDILLNVVSYNTDAQEFYKKMEFEFTGKDATDVHDALPTGKVLPETEMIRKTHI